MARGGLYKSDIKKARDSLLAQGKHPSVDAVRVALGNTGSKTTIHRYLKELEAEEGPARQTALSDALQDLVARLAGQLQAEAQERIAAAEAQAASRVAAAQAAAEQQAAEATGLRTQLQRTELALQAERETLAAQQRDAQALAVTLAQAEERLAGLTTQAQAQAAHLASVEQKHAQAREALEHFRAAAKEQREQELRRHEHQVQGLQVELRQAQDALATKTHELLQLNREGVRLSEHLAQVQRELQRALADLRQRDETLRGLATVREELLALKAQWTADAAALAAETRGRKAAEERLAHEQAARRDAETRAAAAQARAETLDGIVASLRPAPDQPQRPPRGRRGGDGS